tara:strand:+ start:160 stop:354 length:195 start_codon:yes stop_codon:yes gene_type:complete
MSYTPILTNPIEWDGKNKICSDCPNELTINDYEEICINCFNQVEPEEEEEEKNILLYSYLNKTI